MTRQPYPTDLTDEQWELVAPHLPPAKWWGHPRTVDLREIVNAIFYVTRNGIPWRALPHDFPKWRTVYDYFRAWEETRVWEAVTDALRVRVRRTHGKEATASAVIIDSQSTKVTAIPGDRGYDAGKKVNGRKRSIIVDTLGLVLRVAVHPADVSDVAAGKEVTELVSMMNQRITKVFGDRHDGGQYATWVKDTFDWDVEVPSRPPGVTGFVVLPKRWIVERTFGWLTWFRRLSKDYEQLVQVSEAFIYVAMTHLMLRRLTRSTTS